jgi:hypothetical protein
MEWTQIRASWPELSGSILTRWPDADEDEVLAIDGDREAFITYIGRVEKLPREEAEDRIGEWAATAMPADARMHPSQVNSAIKQSAAYVAPGEEPLDADEAFGDEADGERTVAEPPVGRTSD